MGRESKQEVNRGEVKRSHSDHHDTFLIGPTVTPPLTTISTVLPATAPYRTAPQSLLRASSSSLRSQRPLADAGPPT